MSEELVREAFHDLEPNPAMLDEVRAAVAAATQTPAARRRHRPVALLAVAAAAALLAVLLVRDRPADSPPTTARGDPAVERTANRKAYEALRADLHAKHRGDYAVIAGGALAAVDPKLENVLGAAPDAAHRYVFRVGEEGDVDGGAWAHFWYGARFAGFALQQALGLSMSMGPDGLTFSKNGRELNFMKGQAFPRATLTVGPPGAEGRPMRVFVGTVGPPLFLGHDEAAALSLARFEVPGRAMMLGQPHRRVLVRVAAPELEVETTIVGITPDFPREFLVDQLRQRHEFWDWGGRLPSLVEAGREGKWILFGDDRVLGEGATAAEALAAGGEAAREDASYHRYLLEMPRSREPIEVDLAAFGAPARTTLDGIEVEAQAVGAEGPYLVDSRVAAKLRLELAESARPVLLRTADGAARPVRAGYARRPDSPDLALVLIAD